MAKRRPKVATTRRAAAKVEQPDARLIEHCIEYAAQITGARITFNVDPTDGEFAGRFDTNAQARAERALRTALDTQPATLDGLKAKAALVEIALSDWDNFDSTLIDELRRKFLVSLAQDIIRFQQIAMNAKTSHLPFTGAAHASNIGASNG